MGGRKMLGPIILVVVVILVLIGGLGWWQVQRGAAQAAERLLYPTARSPQESPADYGITDAELVTIPSGELSLTAWFMPAAQADSPALVYVHGFSGNRASLLDQAAVMHGAGYSVLLLDLRGHGDSDPAPVTWGYDEAADVIAAYNYLAARPEVDPARIGLVGKSMGGAAVARAAVQLPDAAAVVLQSTYSGLERNFSAITQLIAKSPGYVSGPALRLMAVETGKPLAEVRPADDAAQISAPLLIIHGLNDNVVTPDQGEEIFATANGPKANYWIPGAGHLNIFTRDPERFTEEMRTFLDEAME